MLNIVDFPTPFGPSNPQISPSLTVNEMSSSICLLLNDNEIFSGFRYLFGNSAALSYQFNIYTTFLSLEILVVSLIFGVLFYVFKDKK